MLSEKLEIPQRSTLVDNHLSSRFSGADAAPCKEV
jgi:hypothetical protein